MAKKEKAYLSWPPEFLEGIVLDLFCCCWGRVEYALKTGYTAILQTEFDAK